MISLAPKRKRGFWLKYTVNKAVGDIRTRT